MDNEQQVTQNNDQPASPEVATPAQQVPSYLVQAILVTLFCCLPFGIVAIVFAAQVGGKVQAGDIQGAQEASSKAKTWCWVSFGVGLVGAIIYGVLMALGAVAGVDASAM